jgi:hypothetical protein
MRDYDGPFWFDVFGVFALFVAPSFAAGVLAGWLIFA